MQWLRGVLHGPRDEPDEGLGDIRTKFAHFLTLLDRNNHVLKIIADLEKKSQGEYLFDLNYVRASLGDLRAGVRDIVAAMVSLGGEGYESLTGRLATLDREIQEVLPENRPVEADRYTVPFDELDRDRACSVGSKSAQLGEMKSTLGLPVPDGFAVSAWAYKRFMEGAGLQERIGERLNVGALRSHEDLLRVSEEVRALVAASPVPADIVEALQTSVRQLTERTGAHRFSLRSSALGEDTFYSFAGQYTTFLNVSGDQVAEAKADWVHVRVADTGPGIPNKLKPRIFDPFFTTKKVGEGTGLGLSLCYGIVTKSGGKIDFTSAAAEDNPGGPSGTTFIVSMPVCAPTVEGEPSAGGTEAGVAAAGARLLLVDDDREFRESMAARLAANGFRVVAVGSGETALAAAREDPPDLALLDLHMPGMDGEALLGRLRQEHPTRRVVVFTGDGSLTSAVECARTGAYAYLDKACPFGKLLGVLREARDAQVADSHELGGKPRK